jgi:excisionase family DNA binding protein
VAAEPSPVPRLALSVEEACASIGCSRHFWAEHVAHQIPSVKRGRKRLIPTAALEAWLLDHASTSADPDEGRTR